MRRRTTFVLVAGGTLAAATAGVALARSERGLFGIPKPVTGMFSNGMAYARLGIGPKTLLWIRTGPGNAIPTGRLFTALSAFWVDPFLEAGYSVWAVTRKQNMPKGYTVADMAEDYAGLIADEFDGKVDLVIGEEASGGMIGFCLAARHPDRFGHLAVVLAGYQLSERAKVADLEFARLLGEGRRSEAGAEVVREMYPGLRMPGVARVAGAVLGRLFFGATHPYFASDAMIEAEALAAFGAREILPEIRVPVLLIGCDRDFDFPREVYEETARLIPDCTLRIYENATVMQAGSDRRLPQDVLEFVRQRPRVQPPRGTEQPTIIGRPPAPEPPSSPMPSPVGTDAG